MSHSCPIHSLESLLEHVFAGGSTKYCLFWGHAPSRDQTLTKSIFSQWWAGHPFEIDGVHYATAEHFMMAEKARCFGDEAILSAILKAPSPAAAKKLGRQVAGFDDEVWLRHRWDIVIRGNQAKFGQHADLKTFLLQTGESVLVEASPYDRIWGIGLAASDPDAEKPENWKGLNLLGFALMTVRDHFNKEKPDP